jgi:hypothetical protein
MKSKMQAITSRQTRLGSRIALRSVSTPKGTVAAKELTLLFG